MTSILRFFVDFFGTPANEIVENARAHERRQKMLAETEQFLTRKLHPRTRQVDQVGSYRQTTHRRPRGESSRQSSWK